MIAEQVLASKADQVGEGYFSFNAFFNYGEQQVGDQCAPDLNFDGVFIFP